MFLSTSKNVIISNNFLMNDNFSMKFPIQNLTLLKNNSKETIKDIKFEKV